MRRHRFLSAGLAAAGALTALSACARGPDAEPVFYPREVHVTPENAPALIGRWEGTYTPLREGKGMPGEVVMVIDHIKGTMAYGHMTWSHDREVWKEMDISIAFGLASHIMLLTAHADLMRQGPEYWIEADMILSDGNAYRNHVARTDTDFGDR